MHCGDPLKDQVFYCYLLIFLFLAIHLGYPYAPRHPSCFAVQGRQQYWQSGSKDERSFNVYSWVTNYRNLVQGFQQELIVRVKLALLDLKNLKTDVFKLKCACKYLLRKQVNFLRYFIGSEICCHLSRKHGQDYCAREHPQHSRHSTRKRFGSDVSVSENNEVKRN